MHRSKPAACAALGWHFKLSSLQLPAGRHPSTAVLQLGGSTLVSTAVEGTHPFSANRSGSAVSEAAHGTPLHISPAAMAPASVHVPSQPGGASKSRAGRAFAAQDKTLVLKCT